jgi:GNAT superfamily N-acetyltransferase
VLLGAYDRDLLWGAGRVDLSTYDNLHSAFATVFTHRDRQRQGIGRALVEAVSRVAGDRGRRVLHTEA